MTKLTQKETVMKKILYVLLALVTVLFASCGKQDEVITTDTTETSGIVTVGAVTETTPLATTQDTAVTETAPLTTVQDTVEVPANCASVIENSRMLYCTDAKQEMYLSDYLAKYALSVTKYSVIDLDGDRLSETVLWLERGTNAYYGFLILHESGDTVYAYELTYRAFYELKEDGTFSFSSGASDHGIGKISFANDAYAVQSVAYCESAYDSQTVSYYIGSDAVSKENFEAFVSRHDQKQSAEWQEFTATVPSVFSDDFVFPKTDGSTSTTNLDNAIRSAVLGGKQSVAHTKTYTSFENLLLGKCDLIFTTPLSEAQLQRMQNKGFRHEAAPVAGEGFVFVVNKDNPVDTLTVEQLKDIYSGKITNWSEVGGNDAEIIAYQRNSDSGSQNYMISFMGDTPLMKPVTDVIPATMTGILDVIANYDNGIDALGYSVYAFSDGMYENISEIKYIKVNGVAPSLETLADGTYPLLGYNYAVFSADEAEDSPVRMLVNWIQSDEGQQVVANAGYIPYRKVDGLTLPESTAKTLYNEKATSGITKPETMADYSYECKKLPAFTVEGLDEKVQSFIDGAKAELSAIDKAEVQAFVNSRMEHGYVQDVTTRTELVNGYLSVKVGITYCSGAQDALEYYYAVRTAVFDIYTGKQLALSDLFFEDVDFVPILNSALAKQATKPYSSFGATHAMLSDFSGLYNGEFTYTADSIIFYRGTYFADGVELSLADISEYMVTSVPRDMAGYIDANVPVYKVISQKYSGDTGVAEEKNDITIWYLDSEKSGVPENVCDTINAFTNNIYETYFTEEKLLVFLKGKGIDAEAVTVGPFPDFDITVVGNRYVILNGANLAHTYVNEEFRSYAILEDHYNSYYFKYYFNAQTGEPLKMEDIFLDGWEKEAEYFSYKESFEEENEKIGTGDAASVDLTGCRIVDIQEYTSARWYHGDLRDLERPVFVVAVTAKGEKVAVNIPREYIK